MTLSITKDIIQKFDVPGPRYTSYPTAPNWTDDVDQPIYQEKLKLFGQSSKTLSLYIHIPFCLTMCTFCACNVVLRKDDEKYGDEYLTYLFKEMDMVAESIGKKANIKQLHWGGGTPTFLSPKQIERLYQHIEKRFSIDSNAEVAIEIDPRRIQRDKVYLLKKLGFNRISMGVQDFDPIVQQSINRIQSLQMVKDLNDLCRDLGFNSINYDLIYGLPNQTVKTFNESLEKVIDLRPDRIALYSFAYVPWLKAHQKKIDEEQLPSNDTKLELFLNARNTFLNQGYDAIAMDHFALREDELAKSFKGGELNRNFMGYTVKPADEYIGVGLTSIGFLENTFIQNHKVLPTYYKMLSEEKLPVERGKVLSQDDLIRQWCINKLMCQFQLDKQKFYDRFGQIFDDYFYIEQEHLQKCVKDELIAMDNQWINVTELGKIFIRNVAMGFDWYLQSNRNSTRFSNTV